MCHQRRAYNPTCCKFLVHLLVLRGEQFVGHLAWQVAQGSAPEGQVLLLPTTYWKGKSLASLSMYKTLLF
jgi:hypothetical protein